jgi:uncharacterized protein (DUF4415 family)
MARQKRLTNPLTNAEGDVRELTDEDLARAVPLSGLPESLQAKLRKRGRPFAESTKERITIRLSPDTLEKFKATGPGWQTRLDTALADWLKEHSPEELMH